MFGRLIIGVMAGTAMIMSAETALAACAGTQASPDSFSNFQKNPASWLPSVPKTQAANDIRALATAASANPDLSTPNAHYANFQNAIKTMLGGADSDQGAALGTALGSLAASCSKAGPEEVAFVTALQTGVAQSGNKFADDAFGKALKDPQTASVGAAAGGASTGNGGATGGAPGGGGGTGSLPASTNFGTPVGPETFSAGSGGVNSGTLTGSSTTGLTTFTFVNGQNSVTDN